MNKPSALFLVAIPLAFVFLADLSDAHAGAWSQPAGECYAKVWGAGLFGKSAFATDGETFDTQAFQDVSLQHYVECGIAPQWTLMTSGKPIGWSRYDAESTLYTGPLGLGVRRGVLDGPLQVALEVDWAHQGLVGDTELATDEAFSFRPVQRSHVVRAGASVGLGGSSWWTSADVGFRYVSAAELSPAVVGQVQVGWKPVSSIVLDLHLPLHLSTRPLDTNNIIGAGRTSYLGLGLGASWWFHDSIALHAGVDGVVFARANAATPALQFGVEFRPTLFETP